MSSYGSRNYTVEWKEEGRRVKDTFETTGPPPVRGVVIDTKGGNRVVVEDVTAPEESEGQLLGSIYGRPFRG